MTQFKVLPREDENTKTNIDGEVYDVGAEIYLTPENGAKALEAGLVELVSGTEALTEEASEESVVDAETVDEAEDDEIVEDEDDEDVVEDTSEEVVDEDAV